MSCTYLITMRDSSLTTVSRLMEDDNTNDEEYHKFESNFGEHEDKWDNVFQFLFGKGYYVTSLTNRDVNKHVLYFLGEEIATEDRIDMRNRFIRTFGPIEFK